MTDPAAIFPIPTDGWVFRIPIIRDDGRWRWVVLRGQPPSRHALLERGRVVTASSAAGSLIAVKIQIGLIDRLTERAAVRPHEVAIALVVTSLGKATLRAAAPQRCDSLILTRYGGVIPLRGNVTGSLIGVSGPTSIWARA